VPGHTECKETFPHCRKMAGTVPGGGQPLGCGLLGLLLPGEQYLIRQVWRAVQSSNLIWWSQGHGWPVLNQSAAKPYPKIASRRHITEEMDPCVDLPGLEKAVPPTGWCPLVEAGAALPLHLHPGCPSAPGLSLSDWPHPLRVFPQQICSCSPSTPTTTTSARRE